MRAGLIFVGLAMAFYLHPSSQFVRFLCKVSRAGIFRLIAQVRKLRLRGLK